MDAILVHSEIPKGLFMDCHGSEKAELYLLCLWLVVWNFCFKCNFGFS